MLCPATQWQAVADRPTPSMQHFKCHRTQGTISCYRRKENLRMRFSVALTQPRRSTLLVSIFLCGAVSLPAQQKALSVRDADAVCAKCHLNIYKHYLETPMANASGEARDKLIPGTFSEPASATAYRVFNEDGAAWLSYSDQHFPSQSGRRQLEYSLGSGHLGVTYLYSINRYLLESPVAYYAGIGGYDMKPGLSGRGDIPPALPMGAGCLRCHMSGVQPSDQGTVSHFTGLPFLQTGITCESCHGDASRHIQTAGKISVVNPKTLAPQLRDSVCISCHLEGDISVEKPGRSAISFKPGESISDYVSFFVFSKANSSARGVSEVEQLNASVCKQTSSDKMSCMSCHDPHLTPSRAKSAGFYRVKCLACHNAPEFAASHHPENPDCVSCHMPRSSAANIPHVAWADHRILRKPGHSLDDSTGVPREELVSAVPQSFTDRELALAYFQAATIKGVTADRDKASLMLTKLSEDHKDDVEILGALALLARLKGDMPSAKYFFGEVIERDPTNIVASSNLGILRATSGDLKGALSILKPTFDRNQNLLEAALNLTAVQCLLGDAEGARITLTTALMYSPGSRELNIRLQQLSSCSGIQQR